jgi:FAD/FMN-containing dehydrogenase
MARPVAVELARADLAGTVVDPGHPDYDRLRAVYNAVIDRRPGAIVLAATPGDVQQVVRIAAETGLPLAVRCGGHSFAGLGTCDDGIVCTLSRMNDVVVDPRARTVDVGGGALLGDVDAAGEPYGLVTPAGVVSHTGVGGLTLGGGMGYLSRRFGLTIDSLVEADIVTADGRLSRVAADEQPDLFWAIRGGGGNFGVVTQFRFRMHELGPVAIRRWTYPAAGAAETLRRYRDAAITAPRELTTAFILTGDELLFRAIWSGSTVGADALDRFAFPGGVPDPRTDMRFVELQRAGDDLLPWGRRYYSKGGFLAAMDDRVIRVIADSIADMPIPGLEVYCLQLGGAVGDVDEDATAYAGRAAAYYWISQGVWDSADDDERAIAWCRRVARQLGELSMSANYVNEQSDTGLAHSSYGESKYRRLAELKHRHDPTNLFRLNQNIEPVARGAGEPGLGDRS